MRSFVKIKSSEMAKSLLRLLIKENHALVANFSVANMSYNAIRENKNLAKITGFTVLWMFSFTHLIQMKFPTFANWTSPFPLKGLFIQILIEHSVGKQRRP